MAKELNTQIVKALVDSTNPFLLVNNAGQPMIFRQEHEPYYYVIMAAKRHCPKGYIELAYFLSCLYPTKNLSTMKRYSNIMVALKVPIVTQVEYGKKSCREYFYNFCMALQTVFGTKFNYTAFQTAYNLAQNTFEMTKLDKT